MSRIKLPADYIKIEDKVKVISYKTVAYDPLRQRLPEVTEQEWNTLTGVMRVMISTALAECVNPNVIALAGDKVLAENYMKVFSLAEKLGVIKRYDEEKIEDHFIQQPSGIKKVKAKKSTRA